MHARAAVRVHASPIVSPIPVVRYVGAVRRIRAGAVRAGAVCAECPVHTAPHIVPYIVDASPDIVDAIPDVIADPGSSTVGIERIQVDTIAIHDIRTGCCRRDAVTGRHLLDRHVRRNAGERRRDCRD